MRIALTGNPNSGKTTMFNALTGSNEKVGNWAGVTVDKKEHQIKKIYSGGRDIVAVDLPGAYSITPFTNEESVTSDYIINEKPDIIINIVDATNLSRSLFFTTQLLELGIPTIIALNKKDINDKKGTKINDKLLSEKLGCPVVDTVSTSSDGVESVISAAIAHKENYKPNNPVFMPKTKVIDKISAQNADVERYQFVNKLVKDVEKRKILTSDKNFGDKVDVILTNKWFGIPFFAIVMFLVFFISQTTLGTWLAEGVELENGTSIPGLVTVLELFKGFVEGLLVNANPLLTAILVEGVIGGIIAVVGFLPLVMIMYFLIAILEDCGYMSRVAVILDPIFKKVGLSGRSVIPFVMTVGCAVPGVMASRTIRNERERRATALLAPFMPCGAKIPVIALFAGAFFKDAWWVSPLMYFAGIFLIFIGALIVKKITGVANKKSYFIIEIPEYKFPSLWGAFKSMCSRGWEYIVKAATIILLCNMAVQIMQSFSFDLSVAETADKSILATIAMPVAYLLMPIVGVLSWQLAAAAVTGFIAKENVVGTLAICYVTSQLNSTDMVGIDSTGHLTEITSVAALAYLMFNLFSPPCFAAIGAMRAEMKSAKWLIGGIGLQLGIGYTVSYLVYTVGTLITAPESFNIGYAVSGLVIVAIFVVALLYLTSKSNKAVKSVK